jgi:hypothetical protein
VAKVLYGATSDLGDAWATAIPDDLDAGRLHTIVAALAGHSRACPDASKRDAVRARVVFPTCRAPTMPTTGYRRSKLCTVIMSPLRSIMLNY